MDAIHIKHMLLIKTTGMNLLPYIFNIELHFDLKTILLDTTWMHLWSYFFNIFAVSSH